MIYIGIKESKCIISGASDAPQSYCPNKEPAGSLALNLEYPVASGVVRIEDAFDIELFNVFIAL